ncbi:hypothetical protein [Cuniculiplasma divulgatum]|uniref:hypothetical protein n=1 Tax=Cuniculiplasma divulgatum TaxID=1673428 RepID=UPI0015C55109|nr:hypothetical protein [Cuniculiplasma divulgatum]
MKEQQADTFKCEICGLHYNDKIDAQKCQEWCSKHNSCDLEVTARSIEASKSHHIFS